MTYLWLILLWMDQGRWRHLLNQSFQFLLSYLSCLSHGVFWVIISLETANYAKKIYLLFVITQVLLDWLLDCWKFCSNSTVIIFVFQVYVSQKIISGGTWWLWHPLVKMCSQHSLEVAHSKCRAVKVTYPKLPKRSEKQKQKQDLLATAQEWGMCIQTDSLDNKAWEEQTLRRFKMMFQENRNWM